MLTYKKVNIKKKLVLKVQLIYKGALIKILKNKFLKTETSTVHTAPKSFLPLARSTNCSAISTATLSWASEVLAPKWGVATTLGC